MEEFNIKSYLGLIIGVFLLFIAIILKYHSGTLVAKDNKKYISLHESLQLNYDDQKSYLYVVEAPTYMGKYDNQFYYIVCDEYFMYIVSMSNNDFEVLSKFNYKRDNIKLLGNTKVISNEIKDMVIDTYNKPYEEDSEDAISPEQFDDLFGSYYLDLNDVDGKSIVKDSSITMLSVIFYRVIGIIAIFLIGFFSYNYKRGNI